MSWTYKGKEITEVSDEYEGFVYLITNLTDNRKYVGKKLAKFKTTKPPLKGKKNKRRGTKESDWRDYWGSSDKLLADVEKLGENNFTREILYFCKSRGEMSYLEAREQFERRVLETDEYYNGIINVRVGGSNILRENLKAHQDTVWSELFDPPWASRNHVIRHWWSPTGCMLRKPLSTRNEAGDSAFCVMST